MRNRSKLFPILLLAAVLAPASALADTYDSATLVDITTHGKDEVQLLYDNRVDIVGLHDGVYKALITDEQLRVLEAAGLRIQILDAEMKADRARWAEAEASYELVTTYYTPSKFNTTNPPAGSVMEHLLQQYNAHPDVSRLYNLGASQDGAYDIIAMKVSKNPDLVEAEPKIRLYGNIHGDEKGGVMVTCDVLDTILAGYTAGPQDPTAKKLVDETEIWFIPIGNPYGNAHSTRYNSRGIDLNRNFWGPAGSDAPPAWSEKETQAIRDLTESVTADHSKKRFALSLSFHEGDIVFNSVWNYTTAAPTDEPIFWSSRTGGSGCGGQTIPNCPTLAPHGLAQAYKDGNFTPGFWYTEGYDWYGTKGDTNDWAYGAWTQLDTTIELNTTKTPAASQIPTYCAQHRQAVLNYMMKVFQGIHGVMTDGSTGAPLDGTVAVTATASPNIPVPHAYQAIFTDPVAGDFHRVLQPGTYTVVCSAPGYMTTTITGVVVNADARTIADCPMSRTGLAYSASTAVDSCRAGGAGSGDGVLDAGEDATLQVTLGNPGSVAATGVSATIATTMPGVTITQGSAMFPDVSGGGTAQSTAPHFRFSVGQAIACGTIIPFDIHMTSSQAPWADHFTVTVGQAIPPQTIVGESFDGATFPPSGWAQVDVSGTAGNWLRSTDTVHPAGGGTHSGAGLAYFNSYTSSSGSTTRLYRAAGSAIPGSAASATLTYWMFHDTNGSTYNDRIQAQVSTNGTTWTNVGAAVSRADGSTGWKQHSVSLDAYIGQTVQLAFLGISAFGYDEHIDDVLLTSTPQSTCTMHTCNPPASADLAATASAPPGAATGATIVYALGLSNGGPDVASGVSLATSVPAKTTFVSMSAPAGWTCSTPSVGQAGPVTCNAATLPVGSPAAFSLVVRLGWCAGNGTAIALGDIASATTGDPIGGNDSGSASTTAIDDGGCDDANACTQADSCQAGVCAGAAVGPPGEVGSEQFVAKSTLSWNAPGSGGPAMTYDIARGTLGEWPAGTGASETCDEAQYDGTEATIGEAPGAGSGFWYVVRARTACGLGTYGSASDGTSRDVSACP